MKRRMRSWCARCGQPYRTPTQPTCECAGEPPLTARGVVSNFDPERQKYLARVHALRYDDFPKGGETR